MDQEKVRSFPILRSTKIYLLLGVSFFVLISFFSLANAQNNCSQCYATKRPVCEKRCKGSATRVAFSSCAGSCVASSCSQSCKSAEVKSSQTVVEPGNESLQADPYWDPGIETTFHGVGGECGKCLRRAVAHNCGSKCPTDKVDDVAACRNSCAKLECSSNCQLPNETQEIEKRPTIRDCGECKRVSEMHCRGECEKLKDQPGYIACTVSCVEDKCFATCNPD